MHPLLPRATIALAVVLAAGMTNSASAQNAASASPDLKARCDQLISYYDRYGGTGRSENSDGQRNHTRIGAALDCQNGHYAEGVAAGRALQAGDNVATSSKNAVQNAFQAGYRAGETDAFGSYDGGWKLGALIGPLFGNQRQHQYYYGVAPEFATPERPAYDAPGGYSGWRAIAALSRRYGNLYLGGFVRYDGLHGASYASSPLVRTDHAFTAGFGMSWIFAASNQRVVAED